MNVPVTKPRLTSSELGSLLAPLRIDRTKYPMLIVGKPGYYSKFGNTPGNERGIYDDALFLVTPSAFAAFNGNTDPSAYRKGKGTGSAKGMATLKPGFWPVYRFDMHRGQYMALCQRAGNVTVIRDGDPPYEDTGMHGINIHRGGIKTTSSLGCQTIPPTQWDAFYALAESEAKRLFGSKWRSAVVPYVLLP